MVSSLRAARLLARLLPDSLLAISLLISVAVTTGSGGGGADKAVPADARWRLSGQDAGNRGSLGALGLFSIIGFLSRTSWSASVL